MEVPMQDEAAGATQIQSEDSPAQVALLTPVILSHIMSYLGKETLLTCSLVRKDWLCEARKILKNHQKILAVIKGPDPCVLLKALDGTISRRPKPDLIPFKGLEIAVPNAPHSNCVGYQDPESYYHYILSQLTLKHLKIYWDGDASRPEKSCAAVWLMRKLFASPYSRQLETLYIGMVPPWLDIYSENVLTIPSAQLSQEWLPNLRSLQLYSSDWDVDGNPYIDLRILQGAPKLEKLVMLINGTWAEVVPPEKLKCIVNLRFDPDPLEEEPEELDWLEKVALSGAKLQRLEVGSEYLKLNHEQFADPRYWQILRLLLENSQDTLLTLQVDLAVALKLATSFPLPSLRSLEMLRIGVDMVNWNHALLYLLGHICFEEMFPSLKRLHVGIQTFKGISLEVVSELLGTEMLQGMLQQHRYLSNHFTGELTMDGGICTVKTASMLHRMFPAIKGLCCKLTDYFNGTASAPYRTLWTLWPDLKSLSIELNVFSLKGLHPLCSAFTFNLDAYFCGIHPEEAAELQSKDPKFLRKVQIVPTKPAITCLRNLERLTMRVNFSGPDEPPLYEDGAERAAEPFLFSNVTEFLAFKRIPGLVVTLNVLVPTAMSFQHVIPYVKVIGEDAVGRQGRDMVPA